MFQRSACAHGGGTARLAGQDHQAPHGAVDPPRRSHRRAGRTHPGCHRGRSGACTPAGGLLHRSAALGPRAGHKVLSFQSISPRSEPASPALCAKAYGFSLHAGLRCGAEQRQELEQLCRYITRPAIANGRLSRNRTGDCGAATEESVPGRYHPRRDVAPGIHATTGGVGAPSALTSDFRFTACSPRMPSCARRLCRVPWTMTPTPAPITLAPRGTRAPHA